MPKIAFLGFPAGRVRLKVSQQDTTIEDTIDLDGETGGPSIDQPVAVNDARTVGEGETITVDVLANDTGGGTLTAAKVQSGGGSVSITADQKLRFVAPGSAGTSVVSYTVTNAAGSASGTLTLTITKAAAPGSGSVQLSSTRTTGTAPAGFFFSAKASGFGVEDPYFDVRYKWEFGDPGYYTRHDTDDLPWGKYYDVDGSVILVEDGSVPKGQSVKFLGNDKNVAYGPHVSHVFEKPGEYIVTCEVQKRGQGAVRQTMKVTVKDPALEFPGTDTICVSPSGNYEGAPAGSVRVKTWAEAAVEAKKGPKKRILFHRSETHAYADRSDRDISRSGGWDNLQYGAYGSGTSPRFTGGGFFLRANPTGECAVWGVELRGPYDPRDPWKTNHNGIDAFYIEGNCAMSTIWDCAASGAKNLILVANNAQNIVVGNFHGYNWNNYGMFANRNLGYTGLCGVWLKQHPDTVIGPGKFESSTPYYQDHAPFRCSALGNPVCFNLCDLRSVGSWSGLYQPCLRIGRSPSYVGPLVEEASMDRIRSENGAMYGTGNSGSEGFPRRYLWDKCYMAMIPGNPHVFSPSVSGLHYRNCIAVVAKTPQSAGHLNNWIIRGAPDKGWNNYTDKPEMAQFGVTLIGCTLVDHRSDHPMSFDTARMKADYAFVRIANNVVHCPNKTDGTPADSGDTGDMPLDLTEMWPLTNPGARVESTNPDTRFKTAGSGWAAWYKPLAGSNAHKKASGAHIPVDDFFGRIRGATTSRGAFD